jgi:GntR family transcriptional regulator, transcriptional repressor for pyruvate dehydrogenase complex
MSEQGPAGPEGRVERPVEVLRALRPVAPTRLADHVVTQIRDLVLAEGLEPGERLPSERDLAARLGTSRAIVSQALRTLSLMGLVEVRPGSGAYVTRNPEAMMLASLELLLRAQGESALALAELRYWLERAGARHALRRASASELAELEDTFDRLEASAGRTSAWIAADTMFHATLVGAAANPYLTPVYEAVHTALVSVTYEGWVQRDVSPGWLKGDSWRAQVALHRPIMDALRRGDASALETALHDHHAAILDHLAQRNASA